MPPASLDIDFYHTWLDKLVVGSLEKVDNSKLINNYLIYKFNSIESSLEVFVEKIEGDFPSHVPQFNTTPMVDMEPGTSQMRCDHFMARLNS